MLKSWKSCLRHLEGITFPANIDRESLDFNWRLIPHNSKNMAKQRSTLPSWSFARLCSRLGLHPTIWLTIQPRWHHVIFPSRNILTPRLFPSDATDNRYSFLKKVINRGTFPNVVVNRGDDDLKWKSIIKAASTVDAEDCFESWIRDVVIINYDSWLTGLLISRITD